MCTQQGPLCLDCPLSSLCPFLSTLFLLYLSGQVHFSSLHTEFALPVDLFAYLAGLGTGRALAPLNAHRKHSTCRHLALATCSKNWWTEVGQVWRYLESQLDNVLELLLGSH